jgi:hypothetical protein
MSVTNITFSKIGSPVVPTLLASVGALFWTATVTATATASQALRYDREYPVIEYSQRAPNDAVSRLGERIASGEVRLPFDAGRGYLEGVLRELGIPISSQILVYTKTSFQKGLISPETPRAIYFGDDAYVAWVQDGPNLELSAVDPVLGATFYTLDQEPPETEGAAYFDRQTHLCLRCHDSYSLTGGGVPRHIMGSGPATASGRLASHEGWYLTTPETPIERRWGGWYVTGSLAAVGHLGNRVVDPSDLEAAFAPAASSLANLSEKFDAEPYLTPYSDVVALLVFEHQVHVQNVLTRVGWDSRMYLASEGELERSDDRLDEIVEPLSRALLLLDEAPLPGPVESTSGFAEDFAKAGPRNGQGRSLRELDLEDRVFRYPVSYLVYSEAFDSLPSAVKERVYARIYGALIGDIDTPSLDVIESERNTAHEILTETKPDYARWVAAQ